MLTRAISWPLAAWRAVYRWAAEWVEWWTMPEHLRRELLAGNKWRLRKLRPETEEARMQLDRASGSRDEGRNRTASAWGRASAWIRLAEREHRAYLAASDVLRLRRYQSRRVLAMSRFVLLVRTLSKLMFAALMFGVGYWLGQ